MKKGKLLAFFLAGALALSNIAVVSASNAGSETETTSGGKMLSEKTLKQDKPETSVLGQPGEGQANGLENMGAMRNGVIPNGLEEDKVAVPQDENTKQTEGIEELEKIEALSEDRVQITSQDLKNALSEQWNIRVDENGYVSRSDVESIGSFSFYEMKTLDLTGIEAFVNLRDLTVSGCGISDIAFIEKLPKLMRLNVTENKITDFTPAFAACEGNSKLVISYQGNPREGVSQIFRKFAYKDLVLQEGQTGWVAFATDQKPVLGDTWFQETSNVQYAGYDEQIITISDGQITAKKAGETKVTAKYGDAELSFAVTVQGMGAAVADEEKVSAGEMPEDMSIQAVLNKGSIWNWEDDSVQKISGDKTIQSYVSYWVYRPKNADIEIGPFREEYFGLDADGTLWSIMKYYDEEAEYTQYKIAENVRQVVHYGGRKAIYITESGECYLGYVEGKQVKNQLICKDAQSVNENRYIRKKDGTIIKVSSDDEGKINTEAAAFEGIKSGGYIERKEDGSSIYYSLMLDSEGNLWRKGNEGDWEKKPYATGVSALSNIGYLKNGTLYSAEDHSEIAKNVKEMYNSSSNSSEGYLTEDDIYYTNLGEDKFVKVLTGVKQVVRAYALDEKNDLYYIDGSNPVRVMCSVVKISLSNNDIIAQREDGSIWRLDGGNSVAPKLLCTLDQISPNVLVDKQTGITVSGAESGVTLEVEELAGEKKEELQEKLAQMISGTMKGIKVCDITLKKEGQVYQPNIPVQVTIPIPEGFSKNLAVFHQKADQSIERMNITVYDTTVSFMAESFSPYAIVDLGNVGGGGSGSGKPGSGSGANTGADGDAGNSENVSEADKTGVNSDAGGSTGTDVSKKAPKTADTASVMLYMILALVALTVSMGMIKRKSYR